MRRANTSGGGGDDGMARGAERVGTSAEDIDARMLEKLWGSDGLYYSLDSLGNVEEMSYDK